MKKYRDHYFKKAKQDNYPARSVYKLKEINKRFHVLAPGQKILDLGAAPGSWTLFAAKVAGEGGRVLAADLNDTETGFPANVRFVRGDVFTPPPELAKLMDEWGPFDLVMSDMAPKTSGVKFADQARSLELCERALELALLHLRLGGTFIAKIFEGPDVKGFTDQVRRGFETVKTFKPKSSRAESKEMFVIGLGKKNTET